MRRRRNMRIRERHTRTRGRNELRANVIEYDSCTTGVNWSIFGYISSGEIVPEVMTTELKRSKTGLIAIEGSKQLCKILVADCCIVIHEADV